MRQWIFIVNRGGTTIIRPLYLVRESFIFQWAKYNNLKFINCACKFTDSSKVDSKRLEMKKLINEIWQYKMYC